VEAREGGGGFVPEVEELIEWTLISAGSEDSSLSLSESHDRTVERIVSLLTVGREMGVHSIGIGALIRSYLSTRSS
jgi:hypothetical protein